MGSFIAVPFAGQLLGDYGADVIKVESPGDGDPMRRWGVTRDGDSLWWPAIARNKRSIALDLRDEGGRDVVRRLAAKCDIVLENFRPGTLEKWGLDYATLGIGRAHVCTPVTNAPPVSRLVPQQQQPKADTHSGA